MVFRIINLLSNSHAAVARYHAHVVDNCFRAGCSVLCGMLTRTNQVETAVQSLHF